jgi:hypothetical protein
MGNTQSAEAPRRPGHRLSKPKTNATALNVQIVGISPSASSKQTLEMDLPPNWNPRASMVASKDSAVKEDLLSPKAVDIEKKSRRISLFRSKSSTPVSDQTWKDEQVYEAETPVIYNAMHRYSQLGPMPFELPGDSQFQEPQFQEPDPSVFSRVILSCLY